MSDRYVAIRSSRLNAPSIRLNGCQVERTTMEAYIRANVRTMADLEFKFEFNIIDLMVASKYENAVGSTCGSTCKSRFAFGNDRITVTWYGDWGEDKADEFITKVELKAGDNDYAPARCSTCRYVEVSHQPGVLDSCGKNKALKFKLAVTSRSMFCPLKKANKK